MKLSDIVIDPDLESFLPVLSADERDELKAQIERDGFTDPIIVWLNHATIVDGHNRYRIWQELGSDPDNSPEIIEKKFADKAAVMSWMFQRQDGRRNWTVAQRAMTAEKMRPAIEERAAKNKGGRPAKEPLTKSSTVSEKINTRKELAKAVGVSEDSIAKASLVLKSGTPELIAAVDSGAVNLNTAAQVAKLSPEQQVEAVQAKSSGQAWSDGPEIAPKKIRTKPLTGRDVRLARNKIMRTAETLFNMIKKTSTEALAEIPRLLDSLYELSDEIEDAAEKIEDKLSESSKSANCGPKWNITDDIVKVHSLVDKLEHHWKNPDRSTMQQFFAQLAVEVAPIHNEEQAK